MARQEAGQGWAGMAKHASIPPWRTLSSAKQCFNSPLTYLFHYKLCDLEKDQ